MSFIRWRKSEATSILLLCPHLLAKNREAERPEIFWTRVDELARSIFVVHTQCYGRPAWQRKDFSFICWNCLCVVRVVCVSFVFWNLRWFLLRSLKIRTKPEKGIFFDSGVRSICDEETTKSGPKITRVQKISGR